MSVCVCVCVCLRASVGKALQRCATKRRHRTHCKSARALSRTGSTAPPLRDTRFWHMHDGSVKRPMGRSVKQTVTKDEIAAAAAAAAAAGAAAAAAAADQEVARTCPQHEMAGKSYVSVTGVHERNQECVTMRSRGDTKEIAAAEGCDSRSTTNAPSA